MLRCLVFLWPDFSRVGLIRRGERKRSAAWGVGGREEDHAPDHRWAGGDRLARGLLQGYPDRQEFQLTCPCPSKRLSWVGALPSDEGQVGKQRPCADLKRQSWGTRLERCYWRAWKSKKRPWGSHRDVAAGSWHGQAACRVDLMETRVRPLLLAPSLGAVLSRSVVSDCLRPHGLEPARLLCPWDSPGKNTGVGAMPSSKGPSQPRDQTHVSCTAGGFLPSEPPGNPRILEW